MVISLDSIFLCFLLSKEVSKQTKGLIFLLLLHSIRRAFLCYFQRKTCVWSYLYL